MKSIKSPAVTTCLRPALFLFLLAQLPFDAFARPNLALFRPVWASSVGEDNPPAKALDGIATSRWESQTTDSEWIYVDLGAVYSVDSVVVSWETAAGLDYAIQTTNTPSDNDAGWTTIAHITDGAQGEKRIIIFAPAQTRYVRLQGYKRASIFGYSIWEFEIYGNYSACVPPTIALDPGDRTFTAGLNTSFNVDANGTSLSYQWQKSPSSGLSWTNISLATNAYYAFKPIAADSGSLFRCIVASSCGTDTSGSASLSFSKKGKLNLACKKFAKCTSFEGTDMTAAAAVDDDSSTRWGGNYKTDPNKDSAWIYVDLGAICTIDSVFINWEHSGAKEYYVQTADVASDNDQGWTNVAHISDGNAWEKRPIKIAQTQARFVRVRCIKRISDFSYSLYELEVYTPSSTPVTFEKKSGLKQEPPFANIATSNCRCFIIINGFQLNGFHADIFSAQGQLIRSLSGPSNTLAWDFRDRSGNRAGNGIYILRISTSTGTIREIFPVFR